MQIFELDEQICLFAPDSSCGKMSPALSPPENPRARTSASSWRRSLELVAVPYQFLDLNPGAGNLLGESYWEMLSPYAGASSTLNTGASPKDAVESFLSQILEDSPPSKYYLSRTACLGILRRASERGKELPPQLKTALMMQAGLAGMTTTEIQTGDAYHINQRNEGIDLGGVSGALMHTQNMQMQTFVTQPEEPVDYTGDQTGDKAAILGVNCEVSTGRSDVIAFAANQRDEVRDLHDVAGALGAKPGMKQQTFITQDCLTPWDTQQKRIFTPQGKAPTLAGADGCGGRNPAGLLFAAAFSAGAGSSAGGIGYTQEGSPTLKASDGGNMVPAILCLNDQGGNRMEMQQELSGTLRAQEHGHQPLVLFENHGIDSRYTGPHPVAPTMSARYGTGGNNVPLVGQAEPDAYCITGNAIDRQPQNGGNGIGYQADLSYTLTATDHHAVFSRQRVDTFQRGDVASTESARQHKDATDLIVQKAEEDIATPKLIRRLTPLECERLQGFPDGWTDIPGASDSARYKALGNSVAIPCVEYVMAGIAAALADPASPALD